MSTNQNPPKVKIVLFGSDTFAKDPELPALPTASAHLAALQACLVDRYVPGATASSVVNLWGHADNTHIKEELAAAADESPDVLLVYYAGYAVFRRSQWYLATANSTLAQMHVNGISLAQLAETMDETPKTAKIMVLDCAYLHSPEAGAELWQYAHEELHRLGNALGNACVVLASPRDAEYQREPRLAPLLTKLWEGGLRKDHRAITVADLNDYLYEQYRLAGKAPAAPLAYAPADALKLHFGNNVRYLSFLEKKAVADQQFAQEKFAEALPGYEQAREFYDADEELNAKTRFIGLVLEAEAQFAQGHYNQAKKQFDLAYEIYDLASVRRQSQLSVEKIAEGYFTAGQYELAKVHYARLSALHPEQPLFAERLEVCTGEIRYAELMDSADECYARFEVDKAAERYREALTIHQDRRTQRRLEECTQFMGKRDEWKTRLETDVAKRVRAEVEQQLNSKIAELQKAQLAELEQVVADRVRTQTEQTLETRVWEQVAQLPSVDAYQLYLALFPQGQYATQAQAQQAALLAAQAQAVPANGQDKPTTSYVNGQATEVTPEPANDLPIYEQLRRAAQEETSTNQAAPVAVDEPVAQVEPPTQDHSPTSPPLATDDEDQIWQRAVQTNTVRGYLDYVNQTDVSRYVGEAYQRISQLQNRAEDNLNDIRQQVAEEIGSFSHAVETPEEAAPEALAEMELAATFGGEATQPQAELPADQEAIVAHLNEEVPADEAWQRATAENTIAAYQAYLGQSAEKPFAHQARERLVQLQETSKLEETKDWDMVTSTDTLEAYKAYIQKYPFGNYYAKARFRIAKLEAEQMA
ncbi:MAG: hypothetical protein MUC97_03680 [Bernardetiaceae bacterium]|jgi:hypothetical protein|nr:hypothetical protein [Bernardetiaceae bacterium]